MHDGVCHTVCARCGPFLVVPEILPGEESLSKPLWHVFLEACGWFLEAPRWFLLPLGDLWMVGVTS